MTKAFKLNWHVPVPAQLQDGALADRWTEVSSQLTIGAQALVTSSWHA
jgi:hypothetical protein